MKKFICIMLSIMSISLLGSCAAGYVETEPTYVEVYRTPQPYPNYVWIDGGWTWRNNIYVCRDGYWSKPRPNRVYVQGHWKKEAKGHRWVKGRWK